MRIPFLVSSLFLLLPVSCEWTGSHLRRQHESLRHDGRVSGAEKLKDSPDFHKELKDAKDIMSHASTMGHNLREYDEVLKDDANLMLDYLMPGKRPNMWQKAVELGAVVLVIIWFVVYFTYIYEDDSSTSLQRWANADVTPRVDDPRISLMKPDMVLVFHKPDFHHADQDAEVPLNTMQNTLHTGVTRNKDRLLHRTQELFDKAKSVASHHSLSVSLSKAADIAKTSLSLGAYNSESSEACTSEVLSESDYIGPNFGELRSALLQDVCDLLPKSGFDVSVFSSVRNDELFVCIALRNEKSIERHLQRNGMKLQLQHQSVSKLGIKQPRHEVESSPPFIRYDRKMAKNVWGHDKSDLDIFQNYGQKSGNPVVISGGDRVNIILDELSGHVNLDHAVHSGLLINWYAAHAEDRICELQQCWGRWSLLTDMSIRQPLSLIERYFGSRVAFIFAWNGLYAKMLLCLLPVALVWEVLNNTSATLHQEGHWEPGSVLGFGLAIIIWARVSANVWKREEEFLETLWDSKSMHRDRSRRSDFHGEFMTDPVDASQMTFEYPEWKYKARIAISWGVTLAFCAFVFVLLVLWLTSYQGHLTKPAVLVQAVMIQVFTAIFNWMAEALTIAENHKYQRHYYSSYLKKMFIFQLVNQYSAFFFLAIKQQFTPTGCPFGEDGCVKELQRTLPVYLVTLSALQIAWTILATLLVKLSLLAERRQMISAGEDPPIYSFVEEQSKYLRFRIREQIEFMTQLVLALGYILIFGCVAPLIIPLGFLLFVVQLRAGGVLMITAVNRTLPRMTVGIGPWTDVIEFLTVVGRFFSGYLLVQYGPLFRGTLLITKLSGFCMYFCIALSLGALVDLACPPKDSRSGLLEDRRQAVKHKVMTVHEDKNFLNKPDDSHASLSSHAAKVVRVQEVLAAQWDHIPKLIETSGSDVQEAKTAPAEVPVPDSDEEKATSAAPQSRPDQI